jgi:DNA-binding SARP family transcriptional activator
LLHADGLRGTLLLDYGDNTPAPLTRDLVVLLNMAQEGAERLGAMVETRSTSSAALRPELEARCLGPFELEIAGKRVAREAFARKKALTLLQMLLLKAGAPLDRSTLVERLWPGVDEASGANRLHGVVHSLRAVIEPRSRRGRKYIKNDGELYWFGLEGSQRVDLFEFKKSLSEAAAADRDQRAQDAVGHFEDALALYRGDLFADEPGAEFCLAERADLRERCFSAHKRVAQLLRELGEIDRAIHWLRRAVDLDPLREDLQQDLIESLARAGRRKDAIEQYRSCVRVLDQELGMAPLPATVRLGRMLDLFESG